MSAWEKIIDLSKEVSYSETLGYGYINSQIRERYPYLKINELSNNFIITNKSEPVYVRANVPKEGNYKVAFTLIGGESPEIIQIFTQRRVFRAKNFLIRPKQMVTFQWTVNASAIIPDGFQQVYRDTAIAVTVVGKQVKCLSLKIQQLVDVPTLYMMGDSTMTDQAAAYPYEPLKSYCGWGQMLPLFLKEGIAVSNHAHSGRNTRTFREEGHFNVIAERLKQRDYVFVQFGHNDQKEKVLMPFEGYKERLKNYILDIQAKGAYPVVITPLSRNLWNGSDYSFNDLLIDYAESCRQTAQEMGAALIDLHAVSSQWVKKEGPVEMMKYFYPDDLTHTNDYGAYHVAGLVVNEIKKLSMSLVSYLKEVAIDPIQEAALSLWERPTLESFYSFIDKWQIDNEWVKELE